MNVCKEIPQISGGIEIVHSKSSRSFDINSIHHVPSAWHRPIYSLPQSSEKGITKKSLIRAIRLKQGLSALVLLTFRTRQFSAGVGGTGIV